MSSQFDPKPPPDYPPPKPSSSTPIVIVIIVILAILGCACGIPCGAALLLPAVQMARDAARQQQSMNNLKQIGVALHMYHDTHKTFPPAYIADESGKPRTSWRTLLLPFMEQEPLWKQYDFGAAWDDPVNAAVRQARLPFYQSPRDNPSRTGTSYVVITGPQTLFPGPKGSTLASCTDGTANTIVVVEIRNSNIEWSEPRDVDITSLSTDPTAPNSINLAQGALVLFASGEVRRLGRETTQETLNAMLTPAGNETLPDQQPLK